ncbi:MAG: hypothetical protein ABIX28_01320 [Vicinamibacterales bacterium]
MAAIRVSSALSAVVAVALTCAWSWTVHAQKSPRSIPAGAEFRCDNDGVRLGCPTTDRVRDDGQPYNFFTPATTEGASLNAEGEFYLNLTPGGANRILNLDFQNEVDPGACDTGPCYRDAWVNSARSFSDGWLRTNVVTNSGGETELSGGLLAIPCGQARYSRLVITFTDPGPPSVTWSVRFYNAAFPPSDLVTVTRHTRTSWTIDAPAGSRAVLVGSALVKGKLQGTRQEGTFAMPFGIRVTAPTAPSAAGCL